MSAPTIIIHSDGSVLPDQALKVHKRLKDLKRLYWTSGEHFAFYDGAEKVPEAADAIHAHFAKYL